MTFIIYTIPLIVFITAIALSVSYLKAHGVANFELYGLLIGFIVLAITYIVMRLTIERKSSKEPSILKMNKIL
jgi:positive regulator of sigma E activity